MGTIKKMRRYSKKAFFFSAGILSFISGFSQSEPIKAFIDKQTFVYALKDTDHLALDIYRLRSDDSLTRKPCILFVFGGAFVGGHRDDTLYNRYFNSLAENHFIVISMSYRLGMRGVQHVSKFNIAPLRNAVNMAVEDVYDATNWIIVSAARFGIDTSKIILSGSSSGGITVLGSDFGKRNGYPASKRLPGNFEYAGVISFAGAILSFDGALKYKIPPAPMMMFHGTADKIVPYNKIRFFNKGFYGSLWISKICKENNYPFYLFSEQGMGHEISVLPMIYNIPLILDFLDTYVLQKKPYQTSVLFKDPDAKPLMLLTPAELMKKLQTK